MKVSIKLDDGQEPEQARLGDTEKVEITFNDLHGEQHTVIVEQRKEGEDTFVFIDLIYPPVSRGQQRVPITLETVHVDTEREGAEPYLA